METVVSSGWGGADIEYIRLKTINNEKDNHPGPLPGIRHKNICTGNYRRRYYTSFDGAKIYYEVKGEGFPVVMLHGFTGTAQGWKNGAALWQFAESWGIK
jgi:hypothetical protein